MELVNRLAAELKLNQRQAQGAVGAILHLLHDRLSPASYDRITAQVPQAEQWMRLSPEGSGGFFGVLDGVFANVAGDQPDAWNRLAGHFESLGIDRGMTPLVADRVLGHFSANTEGPAHEEVEGLRRKLLA